jgi:hypothetical protein
MKPTNDEGTMLSGGSWKGSRVRHAKSASVIAMRDARSAGIGFRKSGVAALLGLAFCIALGAAGTVDATALSRAHAARTLSVKDEGHLHLAGKPEGSLIVEEGAVSGTLPGTVKVRFDVGATVTAQFTIYARGGGSVSGHGSGALHSTSLYSTFGGTLSVTSGTGRFKHARGTGGLYGAIDRKTDALTVQTIGKLSY